MPVFKNIEDLNGKTIGRFEDIDVQKNPQYKYELKRNGKLETRFTSRKPPINALNPVQIGESIHVAYQDSDDNAIHRADLQGFLQRADGISFENIPEEFRNYLEITNRTDRLSKYFSSMSKIGGGDVPEYKSTEQVFRERGVPFEDKSLVNEDKGSPEAPPAKISEEAFTKKAKELFPLYSDSVISGMFNRKSGIYNTINDRLKQEGVTEGLSQIEGDPRGIFSEDAGSFQIEPEGEKKVGDDLTFDAFLKSARDVYKNSYSESLLRDAFRKKSGVIYDNIMKSAEGGEPGDTTGTQTGEVVTEDIDQLWTDWTDFNQALSDNPELRDTLLKEITIFDKDYDRIFQELKDNKNLKMKEIQQDYDNVIDSINLDKSLDQTQKTESMQIATDNFVDAHDQLNFNKELAYRSASKSLEKAVSEVGNIAAQDFLKSISGGVVGGNIADIKADRIMDQLKGVKKDVSEEFAIQQEEMDLKKRSAFRQLERQVGTDEALRIVDQAEGESPEITNQNIEKILSGDLGALRPTLAGAKFDPTLSIKDGKIEPTGSLKGQLNIAETSGEAQRSLKTAQLGKGMGLAKEGLEQSFDQAKAAKEREKTAQKAGLLQNRLQFTPFRRTDTGFKVGAEARTLGGKSFAERDRFKNELPRGTFTL